MPTKSREPFSWDEHFHGAVTVGERGQVVIPASARREFNIEPGDKLLILSDPHKQAVMLCKLDSLREFMATFQEGLSRIEETMSDTPTSEEDTNAK